MANILNDNPQITIHGSRVCEYRGIINRIVRETQRIIFEQETDIGETDDGEEEE